MKVASQDVLQCSAAGPLGCCLETLRRALRHVKIRRRERLLRVSETLSLGERRFLAIVQVDRERFLIGGTGQHIALLQKLETEPVAAEDLPRERTSSSGLPGNGGF